jgi:hypothetical protein
VAAQAREEKPKKEVKARCSAWIENAFVRRFGTWEFDARRRAGYLGDLNYFDHEIATEEDENDDEDEDDYAAEAERGDNIHDDGGPTCDPETKPADINEEEAIAMALAIASSTSSLCGTGSPSSFASKRSRKGGWRLLWPHRRIPTTVLDPAPSTV